MTFRNEHDAAMARIQSLEQALTAARRDQETDHAALAKVQSELDAAQARLASLGQPTPGAPAAKAERFVYAVAWAFVLMLLGATAYAAYRSESAGMDAARVTAGALGFALGVTVTRKRTLGVRFMTGCLSALGMVAALWVFFTSVWPSL